MLRLDELFDDLSRHTALIDFVIRSKEVLAAVYAVLLRTHIRAE